MGFDWRAFAEGFATTAAANIKEKGKEARKYRLEQEQLAKDNIMKISRRNSVVNEVLGLTNYLEDQGVSTAQMQAAIASGPQERGTGELGYHDARKPTRPLRRLR